MFSSIFGRPVDSDLIEAATDYFASMLQQLGAEAPKIEVFKTALTKKIAEAFKSDRCRFLSVSIDEEPNRTILDALVAADLKEYADTLPRFTVLNLERNSAETTVTIGQAKAKDKVRLPIYKRTQPVKLSPAQTDAETKTMIDATVNYWQAYLLKIHIPGQQVAKFKLELTKLIERNLNLSHLRLATRENDNILYQALSLAGIAQAVQVFHANEVVVITPGKSKSVTHQFHGGKTTYLYGAPPQRINCSAEAHKIDASIGACWHVLNNIIFPKTGSFVVANNQSVALSSWKGASAWIAKDVEAVQHLIAAFRLSGIEILKESSSRAPPASRKAGAACGITPRRNTRAACR